MEQLIASGSIVTTATGRHLFSVAMTHRLKQLSEDEGWDEKNESWVDYRIRTEQERQDEKQKQCEMTQEIVTACNSYDKNQETIRVLTEALETAKAALGDNAESQALGGSGITEQYYYSVVKQINEALAQAGGEE